LHIAVAYSCLLVAGVMWASGQPKREPMLLLATHLSLLERSYVRCVRERLAAIDIVLSAEEERLMLLYQRDTWTMLTPQDVARAPLKTGDGRTPFIDCSWFLPRRQPGSDK